MRTISPALVFVLAAAGILSAADDAPPHLLRYRLADGETLTWKVVHLATTETTIRGNTQSSESRSTSTKVWRVLRHDEQGNFVFEHLVADVDMSQQVTGRPEETYNSRTDKTPPPLYEHVAETIGKPLGVVTLSPAGEVVTRDDSQKGNSLGGSEITMPLPKEAIPVGHTWTSPDEVRVRQPEGTMLRVQTQRRYTLQRVEAGVATIKIDTSVLTPVDDPQIRSQLLQQVVHGTARFDLEEGRLLSMQLDWDETVVGFNQADSLMKYLARYTQELLPPGKATGAGGKTPAEAGESSRRSAAAVKYSGEGPILRR